MRAGVCVSSALEPVLVVLLLASSLSLLLVMTMTLLAVAAAAAVVLDGASDILWRGSVIVAYIIGEWAVARERDSEEELRVIAQGLEVSRICALLQSANTTKKYTYLYIY